jgi:hypothetical protein
MVDGKESPLPHHFPLDKAKQTVEDLIYTCCKRNLHRSCLAPAPTSNRPTRAGTSFVLPTETASGPQLVCVNGFATVGPIIDTLRSSDERLPT